MAAVVSRRRSCCFKASISGSRACRAARVCCNCSRVEKSWASSSAFSKSNRRSCVSKRVSSFCSSSSLCCSAGSA